MENHFIQDLNSGHCIHFLSMEEIFKRMQDAQEIQAIIHVGRGGAHGVMNIIVGNRHYD